MKFSTLLGCITAAFLLQSTAFAQLKLDLALVEFGGVLPDVVTSGQEMIHGVELGATTNTERVGSGPLKGGKVLFTQSITVRPGEFHEQTVRMWNERVNWSGKFGALSGGALPINLSLVLEVGTDATFRKFVRRAFETQSNLPLGKTIVAQSRQSVMRQKKFTKDGYSTSTRSKAYLLLIQAR